VHGVILLLVRVFVLAMEMANACWKIPYRYKIGIFLSYFESVWQREIHKSPPGGLLEISC
jgi:hypothetical protein